MNFGWGKVSPYLKWGISGGVVGAIGFLGASATQQPGWPGNVAWAPEMGSMAWAGFFVGVVVGATLMSILQLADRSSVEVQGRKRAEKKDPRMVIAMYNDVESGEETAAWHAISLLINYKDPIITRNMLEMLTSRLNKKEISTMDRSALVRHAVKSITATSSQSNIEQLRPYASDMASDIGVQVRRLGLHRGGRDYSLK